jgi:puromycin-sensitive aminopeptidase
VWVRILAGFGALNRLVDGAARERLAGIVRDAVGGPLLALGRVVRPGEDDLTSALRGDLFRAAGTIGDDPEVLEDARRIVAGTAGDDGPRDAAILAASVDIVAFHGDEVDFDTFIERWRAATTPQDEMRYLYALADFRDPALTARLHDMIRTGQVRTQNTALLLRRALLNRETGRDTWRFLTEQWDALNEALPSNSIVRLLEGITVLDLPEDVSAAQAFFADHPVPQGARTLAQLLERQRVQMALRQREADRLRALLAA